MHRIFFFLELMKIFRGKQAAKYFAKIEIENTEGIPTENIRRTKVL
ncbi:unnamed protein product [Brassica oleracea]